MTNPTTVPHLVAGPPDLIATTGLDVLAETLAFNEDFARSRRSARPPGPVTQETRDMLRRSNLATGKPAVLLDSAQNRTIDLDGASVQVRIFRPDHGLDGRDHQNSQDGPAGVYLHLHGGGWSFGSASSQDERLQRIADQDDLVVVSVEYRLAPEHVLPAGIDDCTLAARWLIDAAATEFGTDRLLIGGESAGAHLAVMTLLQLRDRHGITGRFAAAHLSFGVYDLALTPGARAFGDPGYLTETSALRESSRTATGGLPDDALRDPAISPLYADLAGLPPARFMVGTEDPLLDDSTFMAQRWRSAGVPARLEVVAGAMHGFTLFPLTVTTREAQAEIDFLASA